MTEENLMTNYGSDYPTPRQTNAGWYVPVGITSTTDDDGVVTYSAYEVISQTLFEHDISAAVADAGLPEEIDPVTDIHAALCHGVRLQRAAEYPPVTDYLDGVAKGDQEQIDKYVADCLTVKAKYPFPEAQ